MIKVELHKDTLGHSIPVPLILPASRWNMLEQEHLALRKRLKDRFE